MWDSDISENTDEPLSIIPQVESAILTPRNKNFFDAIEPGILPVVKVITELGYITYSSCEGHISDGLVERERHVGILPRDDNELNVIFNYLTKYRDLWNSNNMLCKDVEIEIAMEWLSDTTGKKVRCIDIYIYPIRNISNYLISVDICCYKLITWLKKLNN